MARARVLFWLVCALFLAPSRLAGAQPVEVGWPAAASATVSPGDSAGDIHYRSTAGPRIRIETFDQPAAWRAGIAGVLFEVRRADGGNGSATASLELDYSAFRHAFGGDYASRLNVVRMPDCVAPCGPPLPVAARNDVQNGKITADVPVGPRAARFALTSAPGATTPSPMLGEQPGFVTRSYRPCAQDMAGGNNFLATGDECWAGRGTHIDMPGLAGELVADKSGTWLVAGASGWRVELLRGAENGDNDGEHWQVTSPQGTRFMFGANRLPGGTRTSSVWTLPVFGNHPGEPCWAELFTDSWCQQAYRWNLDYVVDQRGVAISYFYDVEMNHYGRANNELLATPYTRSGHLARIEYLQREERGILTEAAAWMAFSTGDRCVADAPCSTTRPQDWPDVPWDQACSAAPCTDRHTPVFFSSKKPTGVTLGFRR
ncbi:MAG: hypothetical protein ABW224_20860 [Kibdelosporangium sp.]